MRRRLACTAACALALAAATAAWSTAAAATPLPGGASWQSVAWLPASAAASPKRRARRRNCSTLRTRRARNRCWAARHCASRRWRARHKSRAKRCRKRRATKPRTAPLPLLAPDPVPPASGGTPFGTPAEPAHRVQVQAWEFYFTLSRPLVSAGSVKIELLNRGEDPHDLHLRREDGSGGQFAFGSTPSSGSQTQALDLAPGYYYLWCALPGHEANGMHARLRVE
jgi:hypothetical protein